MKRLLAKGFVFALFSVVPCLPAVAQTDQAFLDELIQVTSSGHTFRKALPDFVKPPPPEPSKVAARFDPVLAACTKLTPEQKEFVKANYPKLALMVNDRLMIVTAKYLKFGDWLTSYLRETYPRELTAQEMRNWIDHFKTDQGQLELAAVLAYPQPTDAKTNEIIGKFSQSEIGARYMKIFGDGLSSWLHAKLDDMKPTVKQAYAAELAPEELDRTFDKFVADNYRKP